MLSRIVQHLRCPHCGAPLTDRDHALVCSNRHSFDIAKQGYVNLLAGPLKHSADTNDMVCARVEFLAAGHYAPVAANLVRLAQHSADAPGCVVDIGGGTGYYQAKVLNALPDKEGVLLDISKFAARRAATAHPRIGAIVADTWTDLPIRTDAASVVLNVFAPRNGPELHRIVHPEGALLVVTPRGDHLRELVDDLDLLQVDEEKTERLDRQLGSVFSLVKTEHVVTTMTLDHHDVIRLIGMGPNSWHRDSRNFPQLLKKLPERCDVTLSVSLRMYRPLS